jgi:DNA-binding MarR family transcriptional regulator
MTPMDKGIVSRAVKTLIARGILERRSSEQDGRSSHLFLTSEGENVYSSIVAELDTSGATGRASIVEAEQQEFITALDRMIEKYTSFEN